MPILDRTIYIRGGVGRQFDLTNQIISTGYDVPDGIYFTDGKRFVPTDYDQNDYPDEVLVRSKMYYLSPFYVKDLVDMLGFLSTDKEAVELRPYLNHVNIKCANNTLFVTATDASILSLKRYEGIESPDFDINIPSDLIKLLPKNELFKFRFDDKNVEVETRDYTVISRLGDFKYPPYPDVIPADNPKCLDFKNCVTEIKEHIELTRLKNKSLSKSHKLLFRVDFGDIMFNAEYLMKMCSTKLYYSTYSRACLAICGNTTNLIMPMLPPTETEPDDNILMVTPEIVKDELTNFYPCGS